MVAGHLQWWCLSTYVACLCIPVNTAHFGQIDQIDHGLDNLIVIDQIYHDLDHLIVIDQIYHDLDHLVPHIPL